MALFIGLAPCSSSACCSTRPSSCSNVGCSTALARCSPWPYLQRWFHRTGHGGTCGGHFLDHSAGAGIHPQGSMSDGMTSQAMQQGGMGLILTALILTTPPMAAMFFQGTLGTFMAYSQIGGGASASPSADGRPPGMSAPPPAAPESSSGSNSHGQQSAMGKMFDGTGGPGSAVPGQRGAAIRVMELEIQLMNVSASLSICACP